MKEMLRLDAEGKLNEDQKRWMAPLRPPEELYEVKSDPFQLHNLAVKPAYADILKKFRKLQDQWTLETGDMGHRNESEMIEQMWPGGKQPLTDTPWFVVNSPEDRGSKIARSGGTFTAPVTVYLYCPTQGASLVYKMEQEGHESSWTLFSEPFRLEKGRQKISVRAYRYGYAESGLLEGEFVVQ